jgi:hypothetical protein
VKGPGNRVLCICGVVIDGLHCHPDAACAKKGHGPSSCGRRWSGSRARQSDRPRRLWRQRHVGGCSDDHGHTPRSTVAGQRGSHPLEEQGSRAGDASWSGLHRHLQDRPLLRGLCRRRDSGCGLEGQASGQRMGRRTVKLRSRRGSATRQCLPGAPAARLRSMNGESDVPCSATRKSRASGVASTSGQGCQRRGVRIAAWPPKDEAGMG